MTGLFRAEAVAARRRHALGDVIVAQPLSHSLLTIFLAAIVLSTGLLATLGSWARRETVSGFLSPDKGIVRVHAPRPGRVGRIHVREGQRVGPGSPLLTLLGERVTGHGMAVDAEVLRSIDRQLAEVETRRQLDARITESESERLHAALDGLIAEAAAIEGQLAVQQKLMDRLRNNLDRIRSVADRGYISSDDFTDREENVLRAEQSLASLQERLAANETRLRQTRLALERLPLDSAQRLSDLDSLRAELERARTEFEAQQSVTVTAPIAGTVSALRAVDGESADTALPLLSILPAGSILEAQLFVPTRAIGFVEPGQDVRLQYDAFDYRRYGVHAGTVANVTASVLSPAEARHGATIGEPAYRVTVQIDRQFVVAEGRAIPLQAGMSVRADIVLERRTLVEWLLEPLLGLRGRT